jgi:hypothetical protein
VQPTIPPDVLRDFQQIQRVAVSPQFVDQITRMNRVYEQSMAKVVVPALVDLNKHYSRSFAPMVEQLQRSLASSVIPALEKWQLQMPKMQALGGGVRPDARAVRRAVEGRMGAGTAAELGRT